MASALCLWLASSASANSWHEPANGLLDSLLLNLEQVARYSLAYKWKTINIQVWLYAYLPANNGSKGQKSRNAGDLSHASVDIFSFFIIDRWFKWSASPGSYLSIIGDVVGAQVSRCNISLFQ